MDLLCWILGVACLAFGLLLAVLNAAVLVLWLRRRIPEGRSVSSFPLVGAIFLYVGLRLLPIEGTLAWWWLPFVLDVSCPALLVSVLVGLVRKLRRAKAG